MRQLSADASELYQEIPTDGSIGNRTLMRELGWDFEKYFRTRDELIESPALIGTGRGKGGSVHRIPAIESEQVLGLNEPTKKEHELYPNFEKLLARWATSKNYKNPIIQRTAFGGARKGDGRLSRPDFAVIVVEEYRYVPGKYINVITFEVKTRGNWTVDSAYEALSHNSTATESFLAIEGDREDLDKNWHEELERLEDACSRHGIGLIYFIDSEDDSLESYIDPVRHSPDPYDLNGFIEKQITLENREIIRDLTR